MDKKLKFQNDGKKYIYYSAAPNELLTADEQLSRAYTIVGL